MTTPTQGGSYVRDPETGELTKVTEEAAEASKAVKEPETTNNDEAPATTGSGKKVK